MKLIMTKGLPGSGKSTWAKKQNAIRINKDDLRLMLHNSVWSKSNEKEVLAARDLLVTHFLKTRDVIVDDTNLAPKHEKTLREMASTLGATFEIKDFTHVTMDTCIAQDLKRPNPVGEKVIRMMWRQFLAVHPVQRVMIPNMPDCIICDIDGTLALNKSGRSPYDVDRVIEDELNAPVRSIIDRFRKTHDIILFSGRKEAARKQTIKWLEKNLIQYKELHMRKDEDNRADNIVKREMYFEAIAPRYNAWFVLDDRNRVVNMWRDELGLPCFQVADGDF